MDSVAAAPPARHRAVILTGHYDVVSTRNYGGLEALAFDPEALAPALVATLRAEVSAARSQGAEAAHESQALADLSSGEFIPGRGLLDMKAGLAVGLAILEDRAGAVVEGAVSGGHCDSLVFLAVPDEEGSSHGMLGAVRALPGLMDEWNMTACAAINLDSAVDQGDGDAARVAFTGSVGKTHPFVLFVGRPTHAGAPFDGVNAALLAASFARSVECAVDLVDQPPSDDPPPPPTILYFREQRDHYDVTTPSAVFVSLNVLTHRDGPARVLDQVSGQALAAMHETLTTLSGRADSLRASTGQSFRLPDRQPRVIGWAELSAMATAANPAAMERARTVAEQAADRIDALARFVSEAVLIAGLEGPAAVIGLAPPYYPRAALDPARDAWVMDAVRKVVDETALTAGMTIGIREFFPGISDMSFLYPSDDAEARLKASSACPYGLDPLPSGFRCPVVNIGPWGREYHQRLERMHAGYAFKVLPELVKRTIEALSAAFPESP